MTEWNLKKSGDGSNSGSACDCIKKWLLLCAPAFGSLTSTPAILTGPARGMKSQRRSRNQSRSQSWSRASGKATARPASNQKTMPPPLLQVIIISQAWPAWRRQRLTNSTVSGLHWLGQQVGSVSSMALALAHKLTERHATLKSLNGFLSELCTIQSKL